MRHTDPPQEFRAHGSSRVEEGARHTHQACALRSNLATAFQTRPSVTLVPALNALPSHADEEQGAGQQRNIGTGKVGSKSLKRADRSLVFFVMALQGHDVIIELRNGVFLRGTVYIADVFMKCVHKLPIAVLGFLARLQLCAWYCTSAMVFTACKGVLLLKGHQTHAVNWCNSHSCIAPRIAHLRMQRVLVQGDSDSGRGALLVVAPTRDYVYHASCYSARWAIRRRLHVCCTFKAWATPRMVIWSTRIG